MSLNLEPTEDQLVDEILGRYHAARKLAKQRASKNPTSGWNIARNSAGCRLPLNGQSRPKKASNAMAAANVIKPKKTKPLSNEKRYIRRNKKWLEVSK